MQMSENNRVTSLTVSSAYVKCNVRTGHKVFEVLTILMLKNEIRSKRSSFLFCFSVLISVE